MSTLTRNLKLFLAAVGDRIAPTITKYDENFERLDSAYDIGRIVMSTNPDWDPNVAFPGTRWVRIQDQFLVGAGGSYPVGSTGGTASHFHRTPMGFDGKTIWGWLGNSDDDENNGVPKFGSETFNTVNSLTQSGYFNRASSCRIAFTEGASNMPPYRAVFIWERTG